VPHYEIEGDDVLSLIVIGMILIEILKKETATNSEPCVTTMQKV
jgi:hypothetical protein